MKCRTSRLHGPRRGVARNWGFVFLNLAELIVCSSILLMVLGVSYFQMVLSDNYADAGQTRASMQINSAYSLQRLYFDMHESAPASVTIQTPPNPPMWPSAVSFLTSRIPPVTTPTSNPLLRNDVSQTDTTAGSPAWQAFIIYYLPSNDPSYPLMEEWVTPAGFTPGTTTVSALTAAQLASYVNGTGSGVVYGPIPVGYSIETLSVTLDMTHGSAQISLTAQDQPDPNARNKATYSTTVYLEN